MIKPKSAELTKKYAHFLSDLKNVTTFNLGEVRNKHKINAAILSWLLKNNVIKRISKGVYTWDNKSGIADSKLVAAFFEDFSYYSKQYRKKVMRKTIAKTTRDLKKESPLKVNYDYVTTQNLLEEVKRIKMNPSKHLTEDLCIKFLKESPTYEYQIVRITKETF
tara:strand:+ start:606 stop:1097 length:492 start_codon:yes stop_codon:yes gene_type:complete